MIEHTDILGRPPVMRFIPKQPQIDAVDDDWRGERIMRNIPRSASSTVNVATAKKSTKRRVSKPTKPVRHCAVGTCGKALDPKNKMGVCQSHAHNELCQCPPCLNRRGRLTTSDRLAMAIAEAEGGV
ncbi:MAG: hypothetical protein ABJL49_05455 [Parasphingorhabdus sp.]|uniref:hypothetical protein n=1 Tax=Alphaproteobacteria TaxID=28211 RepID=UPI00326797F3